MGPAADVNRARCCQARPPPWSIHLAVAIAVARPGRPRRRPPHSAKSFARRISQHSLCTPTAPTRAAISPLRQPRTHSIYPVSSPARDPSRSAPRPRAACSAFQVSCAPQCPPTHRDEHLLLELSYPS